MKLTNDSSLSEYLTQDTFVKLIRGIDRFDVRKKTAFSTWVMTIAKNCYLDSLRRSKPETLSFEEQDLPSSFDVENRVLNHMQSEKQKMH